MLDVFNPLDPKLCDADIEWECWEPGDDGQTVTVFSEAEALDYERKGWTVIPWPRRK
jgi:hypothetical protein